jgi:hypothetical protein
VQFLDDEIARLKKEISKLTQERTLLAGSAPESHAYTGRTSENEMLQAVFSAISGIAKWNLPEFLYHIQKPVNRTAEHAAIVSRFLQGRT